jgi:uncharacterized tellurite resistance protein B-like protein
MAKSNFWDSFTKKAADLGTNINNAAAQATQAAETALKTGEVIADAAAQVTQTAAQTAIKAGEVISKTASKATQAVAEITGTENNTTDNQPLNLAEVSENIRLAFYGALFAIATADGNFDKDEMDLIFGIMDLEGMSEPAKRQVQSYIIEAPPLENCLKALTHADERLRFALMLNLIDTAWANDELDPQEEAAIKLAQQELQISDQQVQAIEKFIKEMKEIRQRGLDDNQAADAVKNATSALAAVGVPIAAVYFCGSVVGLSAAGITSGLAALGALAGIGGMVPGIGVAVLLGAGVFMGVSHLLDTGDKQKKAQLQAEQERRAKLIIKNLQETLNSIIERVESLQQAAADAEANKEAIHILTEKMKKLQQLINKRQQGLGEI